MSEMYETLCSYENLELAFSRARKGKTKKSYVIEFESNLKENLLTLRNELLMQTYRPKPLTTFILCEPKTRKISRSDFRDRVIHHALCNVIEPLFEKSFIFDSYANRIRKGTLKAIQRFDYFKRKVTKNFSRNGFVLKADIKHYFETVDQKILLSLVKRKIPDDRVLWLIERILANYSTEKEGKGMPLGNLTSQFFANVYLNELDQFVKHKLRADYYVRYVDDFVILHHSPSQLQFYKKKIDAFLKNALHLELHPDKSKILCLTHGTDFLGLRIFPFHKRIKQRNMRKFQKKFNDLRKEYRKNKIEREKVIEIFEGWLAYISHANTYKYQRHLLKMFNSDFPLEKAVLQPASEKYKNLSKKIEEVGVPYSTQKTLQLFKSNINLKDIAKKRNIKEATVWEHLAQLIEHNQLSLWKVLPKEQIEEILPKIYHEQDTLRVIKDRISDNSVTFNEIHCVFAYFKNKKRKKSLLQHIRWYKKVHCFRKCYFNEKQRKECSKKFDVIASKNLILELNREKFLTLFNFHLNICVLSMKKKLEYISWRKFIAS